MIFKGFVVTATATTVPSKAQEQPETSSRAPADDATPARAPEAKRPKHIPIAYKLAIVITLLVTTVMGLLGLVVVTNQTQLLREQMQTFGETVVKQLADSSRDSILAADLLPLEVMVTNLAAQPGILGAGVYADDGKVLAKHGALPEQDIATLYTGTETSGSGTRVLEWAWYRHPDPTIAAVSFVSPVRFQNLVAGHVVVTFSRATFTAAIDSAVRAVITATLLMICLGVVLSFVLGKRLSRPIRHLMTASRALGRGDLTYRITERRNDELGHLMEAFNHMADGLLQKDQVERVFSRYVSSNVAKQVLENLNHVSLGGHHVNATVLFADIVGFTSISEKMPPNEVADLLNEYFAHLSTISRHFRGTIDKFIGDCVMVVFGVPEEDPYHAFHAVACAVMTQRLMSRLNATRPSEGKIPVSFRIGINGGEMLAGNMGSPERMQYTVVGDAVNLAARLYAFADSGQIVITEDLYNDPEVQPRVIAQRHASIRVRGREEAVTTYLVSGLVPAYQAKIDERLERLLTRMNAA